MSANDQFYEEDEPLDTLMKAFERGEKHVTKQPSQGRTEYFPPPSDGGIVLAALDQTQPANKATEELVTR
ncbi:MAG: hypothetical protein ACRDT1_11475 [Micromonosporaceae bacterium]